jgi:hypothetical protein
VGTYAPGNLPKATVNLNKLKGNLKSALEGLATGDIAGPVSLSEGRSVVKVTDKAQLDHALLESTLKLKQVVVKSPESALDDLKEQKVNCLNFDKLADNLKLQKCRRI